MFLTELDFIRVFMLYNSMDYMLNLIKTNIYEGCFIAYLSELCIQGGAGLSDCF